jgi:hypothetical protein
LKREETRKKYERAEDEELKRRMRKRDAATNSVFQQLSKKRQCLLTSSAEAVQSDLAACNLIK